MERRVDVAVSDLDVGPTDINGTRAAFVAPALQKNIFGIRVVPVCSVVVDEAVETHEDTADRDMSRVG